MKMRNVLSIILIILVNLIFTGCWFRYNLQILNNSEYLNIYQHPHILYNKECGAIYLDIQGIKSPSFKSKPDNYKLYIKVIYEKSHDISTYLDSAMVFDGKNYYKPDDDIYNINADHIIHGVKNDEFVIFSDISMKEEEDNKLILYTKGFIKCNSKNILPDSLIILNHP